MVLDEFGEVIAPGGSGVVIASQSGHRLPALTADQDRALATTPADELSPAGRAATPDEIGALGAFVMGRDGAFMTGSDLLIDGGVTASYFYGPLAPEVP